MGGGEEEIKRDGERGAGEESSEESRKESSEESRKERKEAEKGREEGETQRNEIEAVPHQTMHLWPPQQLISGTTGQNHMDAGYLDVVEIPSQTRQQISHHPQPHSTSLN